ncbi:hypothetical protein AVEN_13459-1 [Araneus ventricosus]|uniref:Uncharacterized protein n=1 Tax=Araneus ventricosus TaxID=182803 RepID=A0A4Y2PVP5_ARAVE|nr:hypothetical protein AVEN_13459-1 [Araneus ventricosus]
MFTVSPYSHSVLTLFWLAESFELEKYFSFNGEEIAKPEQISASAFVFCPVICRKLKNDIPQPHGASIAQEVRALVSHQTRVLEFRSRWWLIYLCVNMTQPLLHAGGWLWVNLVKIIYSVAYILNLAFLHFCASEISFENIFFSTVTKNCKDLFLYSTFLFCPVRQLKSDFSRSSPATIAQRLGTGLVNQGSQFRSRW